MEVSNREIHTIKNALIIYYRHLTLMQNQFNSKKHLKGYDKVFDYYDEELIYIKSILSHIEGVNLL